MATAEATSLPYHEPGIVTILTLTSLLLLSNVVNFVLDRLLYCGLIGQILIGVAWGTPGAKWLDESLETAIVQLGYLGLILLVYEGGLSTSFQSLKANIVLTMFVALTGIVAPIGLSFTLNGIANATPLQSFAAGAALCSTSLGTTFTILGTTGLLKTRLGVVLTSAAMLDDVVGLVMVQVISNLGRPASGFSAVIIVRPILVSIAFTVVCPLLCWLVLKPVTLKLNAVRENDQAGFVNRLLCQDAAAWIFHFSLLVTLVSGASYAGTSNLFAAYLAGAIISWWDAEVPHVNLSKPAVEKGAEQSTQTASQTESEPTQPASRSGMDIFEKYYAPANKRILKPFFFTSIGFSIPITRMFNGPTVWRGVIYSILMATSKLLCGAWLIRMSITLPRITLLQRLKKLQIPHLWGSSGAKGCSKDSTARESKRSGPASTQPAGENIEPSASTTIDADAITPVSDSSQAVSATSQPPGRTREGDTISRHTATANKPFSLYPAAILGLAMIARGEIGFLISSLAESNGILSTDGNGQVFLVVTWAIVLCTLIAPVGVGLLVQRVKRLETRKESGGSERDVLGVWGIE